MTANACNKVPFTERNVAPAAAQPCQECPFRKVNRGREHPDKAPYTDNWLTTKWRRVSQVGTIFACHMFDGGAYHYSDEIKAAGFKKPADLDERRECAGMVAMVRRELEAIMESPTYAVYQESRPYGLSSQARDYFLARLRGEIDPPLRMSDYTNMAEILDMHDVVNPGGMAWTYDSAFISNLDGLVKALSPSLRECDCDVCVRHDTVHEMRALTTAEGQEVDVDADLHPLLAQLANAGVRTVASCIDIHQAIATLAPDLVEPIMNLSDPKAISYAPVMRRRAPFIELRIDDTPERLFLAALRHAPGIEINEGTARAQIIFNRDQIPLLEAIAAQIPTAAPPEPKQPRKAAADRKHATRKPTKAKRRRTRKGSH